MADSAPREIAQAAGSRVRRLGAEGMWLLVGQLMTVAGSLVAIRVLTEWLTPSQYGELALILALATLCGQAALSPAQVAPPRFWVIASQRGETRALLRGTARFFSYGVLAIAIVGLLVAAIASVVPLGLTPYAVGVAIVLGTLTCANVMCTGLQNAARQRRTAAALTALDSWLKVALAAAVCYGFSGSSGAVAVGYILSSIVILSLQVGLITRLAAQTDQRAAKSPPAQALSPASTPPAAGSSWVVQMWGYGWPFAAWGGFTWAQQTSDRWALQTFADPAAVGGYAVLFQLGYTPVALATSFFVTLLGPILHQISGDAQDEQRNNRVARLTWLICGLSILATLSAALIAFLFHQELFKILVAQDFLAYSDLLYILVLAGGLFAAAQVLALRTMADMTVKETIPSKIGSALIGIAANAILVAQLGVAGAALGVLTFSVVYLGWTALVVLQLERRKRIDLVRRM
jgi:O-antigen/teichoic acid export membrane protein